MTYLIQVHGCHDSTWLVLTTDDSTAAVLTWFAEKVTAASNSSCEPTIKVTAAVDVTDKFLDDEVPELLADMIRAAKGADNA